jgi:integrase/recombinase XerD
MKPLVTLKPFLHRDGEQIGIYFENYESINILIRKKAGAKWSQTGKCWYVPLNEKSYKQVLEAIKEKTEINNSGLKEYLEKRKSIKKETQVKPVEKTIQKK